MQSNSGPLVGVLMGDPCGVGPELVARVAADRSKQSGRMVVIGDPRVLDLGKERAGVRVEAQVVGTVDDIDPAAPGIPFLKVPVTEFEIASFDARAPEPVAGRYTMEVLQQALDLAKGHALDAVAYAPMSKIAMNRAGWTFRDGIDVCTSYLGFDGIASELNVLDDLWVARVTSHVPYRKVPELLTVERIAGVIELLHRAMRAAGVSDPTIAVAGLNPHCGEDGLCGTEEIDVIAPAIELARSRGLDVVGPIPADTIYLEARRKGHDGIVAMYHDQCQVANKLLQFETGIAVHGGSPVPTVTVGHGTAFDIVGKGMADTRAMERAIRVASTICGNRGLYDGVPASEAV